MRKLFLSLFAGLVIAGSAAAPVFAKGVTPASTPVAEDYTTLKAVAEIPELRGRKDFVLSASEDCATSTDYACHQASHTGYSSQEVLTSWILSLAADYEDVAAANATFNRMTVIGNDTCERISVRPMNYADRVVVTVCDDNATTEYVAQSGNVVINVTLAVNSDQRNGYTRTFADGVLFRATLYNIAK